ncbi:LysR family transcriptional regulator [Holophaga foetida]|uniref:LysR family transcriptional regulator n=1 Tax=Holophaga foetida TaxID=35839 RepID=UPI0002474CFB|nr:LysR family transcriptional regulator [Holophaga foetida]
MDIKQLQCFLAVAERMNFTRAAEELQMTQSGISYQISALEKAMEAKLFVRNSRSVHFTEVGAFFHRHVRKLVDEYESIMRQAKKLSSRELGSLTIGFVGGVEMKLLPSFIEKFRSAYPHIEIKFSYQNIMNMDQAILNGDVDLGFTLLFNEDRSPEIQTHAIFKDHSVVMVPPEHPFATRKHISFADLKKQPIVTLGADVAGIPLEWLKKNARKRGFNLNIVHLFSDFSSLSLAVETGMGISVHSRHIVEENAGPRIRSVELDDEDFNVDFAVAWRGDTSNANVQLFLQAMDVTL